MLASADNIDNMALYCHCMPAHPAMKMRRQGLTLSFTCMLTPALFTHSSCGWDMSLLAGDNAIC